MSRLRFLDVPAKPLSGSRGRAVGTLVLIHGFPLSARMWEPQLVLAEQGWRLIVPHLRGFDEGPAGRSATSMDDSAGDVIDLLDSLHVEQAVIGGLSMGGYVTFALLRNAAYVFSRARSCRYAAAGRHAGGRSGASADADARAGPRDRQRWPTRCCPSFLASRRAVNGQTWSKRCARLFSPMAPRRLLARSRP